MGFSIIVVPAGMPEMEEINGIFEGAGVNHGTEYNEMTGEKTGRLWAEGRRMDVQRLQEEILKPLAPYLADGAAMLLPDGLYDPDRPASFAFDKKAKGWNRHRLFLVRGIRDLMCFKHIEPAYRKMKNFVEGLF